MKFNELSDFEWQIATQAFNWASRNLKERANMFLFHEKWRHFYVHLCNETAWELVMQHKKSNKMLASMMLDFFDDDSIKTFMNQETKAKCLSVFQLMSVERILATIGNIREEKRRALLQNFDKKEEVLEQLTRSQLRRKSNFGDPKQSYSKAESPNIYIATPEFMLAFAESARRCSHCLDSYADFSNFFFRCPEHTVHEKLCAGKGDTPCPACWNYS
jgi:hypothetical protein